MKELWRISACLAVVAALTAVGIRIGSSALTVMSESQPMENRICVILDPGHGGEDGGATSCTGILESGINLEIALRLEDMLHELEMRQHITALARVDSRAIRLWEE